MYRKNISRDPEGYETLKDDEKEETTILDIPQPLLTHIFSFLKNKDLAQVRLVRKSFRNAAACSVRTISPCLLFQRSLCASTAYAALTSGNVASPTSTSPYSSGSSSSSSSSFIPRRTLSVSGNEVDILEQFPFIESIDLSVVSSSHQGEFGSERYALLKSLEKSKRLRVLWFRGGTIGSRTGQLLGLLESLRYLDVSDSDFYGSGLEHIGALQQLTFISLQNCTHLDGNRISRLFERLPLLQEVDLGGCQGVNDAVLESLSKLSFLSKCNLSSCDAFTANGLSQLCSAPELKSLLLPACWHLNDACMESIASNAKQLECLSLFEGGEMVTDVGLAALSKLTRLTCLDLG